MTTASRAGETLTGDQFASYALDKPGAWLDEPWEGTHVAKVGEKIFVFLSPESIGVKAGRDRQEADEWLCEYPASAQPMPYIGRFGWNTLRRGAEIPDQVLREALDDSYAAVVAGLPRSQRP